MASVVKAAKDRKIVLLGWLSFANGVNLLAHYFKLDCSKASAELGWIPRWGLERSLESIVEWNRECQAGRDLREVSTWQLAANEAYGRMARGVSERSQIFTERCHVSETIDPERELRAQAIEAAIRCYEYVLDTISAFARRAR